MVSQLDQFLLRSYVNNFLQIYEKVIGSLISGDKKIIGFLEIIGLNISFVYYFLFCVFLTKAYIEHYPTSSMELFCENS